MQKRQGQGERDQVDDDGGFEPHEHRSQRDGVAAPDQFCLEPTRHPPAAQAYAGHKGRDEQADLLVNVAVESLKGKDDHQIKGHAGKARGADGKGHRYQAGAARADDRDQDDQGQHRPEKVVEAEVAETGQIATQAGGKDLAPVEQAIKQPARVEVLVALYGIARLQELPEPVQPVRAEFVANVIGVDQARRDVSLLPALLQNRHVHAGHVQPRRRQPQVDLAGNDMHVGESPRQTVVQGSIEIAHAGAHVGGRAGRRDHQDTVVGQG